MTAPNSAAKHGGTLGDDPFSRKTCLCIQLALLDGIMPCNVFVLALAALPIFTTVHATIATRPLYKDPSQPISSRVQDLLLRMTLKEKAAQLGYGNGRLCGAADALRFPDGVGGVAAVDLNCTNAGQVALMNATRLGIPVSYYAETTHSGGAPGTTVFPMPVSQGASWNVTLVEEIGRMNALELRSSGGDQGLSPILQVCTDPRFGRMEENFAEDPLLVSHYGVAALRGLQGRDGLGGAGSYLGSPKTHVVSQAKHFALYGAGPKDGYTPMGGGPSLRTTFEVYLRPWRDFGMAGGRGVMAAHNMIDWVPCHANHKMLTGVLRNRFGLRDGYIGSDNTNVEGLHKYFIGFARDADDAAVISMAAGVDQDMPGAAFLAADRLVLQGMLDNSTLNRAVGNILRKKFASGLFDSPTIDPGMVVNINSPEHRATARSAASEGTVLLKNDGSNVLPVGRDNITSVAVVGPFGDGKAAEAAMLGGYSSASGAGRITVTVAAAMRARGLQVTFVQGSAGGRGGPGVPGPGQGREAAIAAAAVADLTIAVVGTMACGCCDRCGNGEVGDRSSLDMEDDQGSLVAAVANATAAGGKPLVVVLVHGRPVTFGPNNSLLEEIPALLASWRAGEEGGNALADVIFGDVNPSGKLAQAWPRSAGHIHGPSNPWYQPHSSMTSGDYFTNGDGTPISALYPFGYGLSYTTFAFSAAGLVPSSGIASVNNGTSMINNTATVQVTVQNTGTVAGATPVMVTFAKTTRLVVRYLHMLAGFTKVFLGPGQSETVSVRVRAIDLARFDPRMPWTDLDGSPVLGAYVVDGGVHALQVGGCVPVGAVWDDSATCNPHGLQQLSLPVGVEGETYVYL